MATRIGRVPASLTDAYLTMGAGTRAVSTDLGTIFDTDEPYGDAPRRRGVPAPDGSRPDARVLHLDVAAVDRVNDVTDYDAKPGAFGQALGDHDITRGHRRTRTSGSRRPPSCATGGRPAQRS